MDDLQYAFRGGSASRSTKWRSRFGTRTHCRSGRSGNVIGEMGGRVMSTLPNGVDTPPCGYDLDGSLGPLPRHIPIQYYTSHCCSTNPDALLIPARLRITTAVTITAGGDPAASVPALSPMMLAVLALAVAGLSYLHATEKRELFLDRVPGHLR